MLIIFGKTIFETSADDARVHLVERSSDGAPLFGVYVATKEVGWWRLQEHGDHYTALLQYKKVSEAIRAPVLHSVFALNTEKTQTVKSLFELGALTAKDTNLLTFDGAEWYPSGASFVGKPPTDKDAAARGATESPPRPISPLPDDSGIARLLADQDDARKYREQQVKK